MSKPSKKVSAKGAALLANLIKGKKNATAVDAEDLKDGGVDEAKEKE